MTVKDLEKLRDDLVKVPGVEKDITIALYNIGISITERLDTLLKKTDKSVFEHMFGKNERF